MTDPPDFDLQAHSTCSDGALPPSAVVARAAAAGVRLLALTDHDTLDGVAEALAAGPQHGVRVVPACEISALTDGGVDHHILGYQIDPGDAGLCDGLADSRAQRRLRAARMLTAFDELGLAVDELAIERLRDAGRPIGRPHLAAAVVGHPANRARLEAEGCAEATAFLEAYLIPGRPAHRPRGGPTIGRAIELIHEAGGLAVWAHPFWEAGTAAELLATLDRYAALGLDGVEAFYVTHTREQVRLLHARATQLGLLITGSADFHGPDHARFNRFRAFALHGLAPRLGAIG
ncbi:MAG: PHP domain-containing protein [Actinobacteria bacterium]|nr:PHP domain-containing protein [Actinomycetota bacterium]